MQAERPEVFFHPGSGSAGNERLYVHYRPSTAPARGAVVFAPPFAEEMNKSRRMVALQARRLAAAGYGVLVSDLKGCGDNPGDIAQARWEEWVEDVCRAARWLTRRHEAPLWLWGLRSGALLASAAARLMPEARSFLFWQPSTQGSTVLQQFLRMKAAADMLEGSARGVMENLRRQLRDGQSVEVAGYLLPPAVAAGLQSATLPPPEAPSRLEWLEVHAAEGESPSPATVRVIDAWRAAGSQVRLHAVAGQAFWQTTDIEEVPALLDATELALRAEPPPPGGRSPEALTAAGPGLQVSA